MREGMRTWCIRLAWTLLIACGAMLLGLRLGRPLYYTDGQQPRFAGELAHAGMLDWPTPAPQVELPGPVLGRVAALPDGRLLYGRTGADGSSDLVLFDPARPGLPPEPAFGLNTPHHELAPAVGADGRIWFCSDRPGGAGGYDLYVAPFAAGSFGQPEPVSACNTSRDETDPAPSPVAGELVFVRLEPQADGRGTLMLVDLGGGLDPAPLLPFDGLRRAAQSPNDRDPVFDRDGAGLWFLRQVGGERPRLFRMARVGADWDAPRPIDERWGATGFRSPLPLPGFELRVLAPRRSDSEPDLWFAAAGRELQPWWPGQQWLELLLLAGLIVAAVLLVLLYLGRRWTALDLVTQCLLLSLLVHLLLMLWLMRVEIVGSLLRGDDESASGLEVTLVSAEGASSAADGPRSEDLAAMAAFTPEQRSLAAAAPAAAAEAAMRRDAAEMGPDGAFTSEPAPQQPSAMAMELQDANTSAPSRAGADAIAATAAQPLGAVAPAAAAAAQARAAQSTEAVAVTMPGTALAPAERSTLRAPATPMAAATLPVVAARELAVGPTTVADAPTAESSAPVRRADADPQGTITRSLPGAVAAAQAEPATTAASRAAIPAAATEAAAPTDVPGTELAAAAPRARSAPAAARSAALPAPSVRQPMPRVGMQDGAPASELAAARQTTATASPMATAAPLALSAVAPTAADRSTAAARESAAPPAAAPAALPRPGSDLPAMARALRAVSERASASPSTPSSQRRPQAIALRDQGAARAAAVPATAAPLATSATVRRQIEALAAPAAAAVSRPQRSPFAGLLADTTPRVAPPGSLLERAASRPMAAAPATAQPLASTPYSNRFGPAKAKALEQFGGSVATERAVANGLRYLASIQKADGSWGDQRTFHDKYGNVYVGKTALCLLAFLGAGHTPASGTEYSDHVRRAVAHLVALQDPDSGAFGVSSAYGHGITTYALAECYGLTKDPALRRPVEEGLTWILQNQGPRRDRRNQGGWGYFSPGLPREDDYARMSVSSWMVMALESAKLSGIDVPTEALTAARRFVELAYDRDAGWFRYAHKPERLNSSWPTLPASTPAAAFMLMLLGSDKDDERVRTAAEYTAQRRPQEYRRYDDDDFVLRGQGNVYFWYYGSLCCFLAGGEVWERWNQRLSTILPAAQNDDGSFTPIDQYASYAGDTRKDRSYTTAMCVLSLEVYYRYFTPLLVGR